MEGLEAKVMRTIEENELLFGVDRVLVACSGGPDSVCLLHLLNRLSGRYHYELCVFYLNHRLRAEAALEAQFVHNLSRSLGLRFIYEECDVAEYARRHRLSIETGARVARYRLLEAAADSAAAQRIALGHNLQDQAETIILNLLRGAGRRGLSGMSVKRGRFIRPLISVPREEVLQYLSQYGISYCQDRSNFEIRFRRNFVRAEILPRFLALNPGFLTIADRTSRLFKAEDELLDSLADEALNRMVVERSPDGFCLDIKQFLGCNDVIKWRIIRRLRPGLSFDEIGRVLAIAQGRVGARVELLRGWIARRESDGLYLGAPPKPFPDEVEVAVPGSTRVEELRLILETEVVWGGIRPEGLKCEAFDLDAIEPPIKLRARRAGDRLVLGDKSYQKRLKSIFIDDKVPRRIRDRIPLLCDRAGVLWVVGGRRSARARIGPKTRRTLVVRFERWNGSLNQVVA